MKDLKSGCLLMTVVVALLLLGAGTAFSGQSNDVADVEVFEDALQLDLKQSVVNATISIAGPDDFTYQEELNGGAYIPLDWMGRVNDGYYKYEIKAASDMKQKNRKMENGRQKEPDMVSVGLYQSGGFRVKNGMMVNMNATEEE